MGPRAAQAEVEPGGDVLLGPMRGAIRGDGTRGARNRAVGVAGARPDMPLVEMGVDLDKARPQVTAGEIDCRAVRRRGRRNPGDRAALDRNVHQREAVAIEQRGGRRALIQQRGGDARAGEPRRAAVRNV